MHTVRNQRIDRTDSFSIFTEFVLYKAMEHDEALAYVENAIYLLENNSNTVHHDPLADPLVDDQLTGELFDHIEFNTMNENAMGPFENSGTALGHNSLVGLIDQNIVEQQQLISYDENATELETDQIAEPQIASNNEKKKKKRGEKKNKKKPKTKERKPPKKK